MGPFGMRDYRRLFTAQLVALSGNGLATVALGLLAYQLAGPRAGAVLGTALAVKMIAYVVVAPIATAYAGRFERRRLLVSLDLTRAAVVAALPLADRIWHVYLLIAVLQTASAAFTPTFQAVLPDLLPDERDYTRALSLSQLASTMETLLSPLLTAILVSVVNFHWLFAATAAGFLASAALVASTRVPDAAPSARYGVRDRIVSGIRIFAATPRLRGVLGLNLSVAAVGAVIMVNTVNLVQQRLGRPEADVAWLLTANGAGALVVALAVPWLLQRISTRSLMVGGAATLSCAGVVLTAVSAADALGWRTLVALWVTIGAGTVAALTPVGRVLRRSSDGGDRPALFAAQFSLSHACWLVTYPIAGWVATAAGFTATWLILTVLAVAGTAVGFTCWSHHEPAELAHVHPPEFAGTAHVRGAVAVDGGFQHAHPYVIDPLHPRWPSA
ncbi:MFS transporter [Tsukamurella sp. 8F]|uniref:MFS transporter n=1 Tax=unclassified Tsukamurella TaxID=2633480 RepID=UPI0023B92E7B|nr:MULTISPECIES: MFS transporter [unclassified Tsukamurella]MDF0531352.1 MFS transporter [Tsukamurella sp. 8J]MDF0588558.1 MFS transporter [Tsukamurella sp. 8F]